VENSTWDARSRCGGIIKMNLCVSVSGGGLYSCESQQDFVSGFVNTTVKRKVP
jgi:hypothetical protein